MFRWKLSSSFPIENNLKQGDTLSSLLLNFGLECAIRKVQETNLGLDMNGTHQVLTNADDVNLNLGLHMNDTIRYWLMRMM